MSGRILSGSRELSQAELLTRAARAAQGFMALGVAENDAVALVLRNDFAFFEAALGANQAGAYAVPVNWHFKADEVGYILRDCGARAVVIHADLLASMASAIPDDVAVLVVPVPPEIRAAYGLADAVCRVPEGRAEWNDWVAGHEPWPTPPASVRTNMIYTSGTTGLPKGVRRTPATAEMAERLGAMVDTIFDIRPGRKMRTVITGPVYHSAPNLYALSAAREGGLVILQPRFDAEELLRLIESHRITHLHMVPTMFVRLLKLPDAVRAKYDLSSLEFVVHAAAPCPAEVKRRMIEWWGPVINEYYGATETGGVIFHTAEEALRKPGTVGRPIEYGQLRILDAEGRELPPGAVGEVYIRIAGFPDFTYNKLPEKRAECEKHGLISVGDMGYVDDEGYLFLCDRVRDMVISGGVNIYPAEIEAVLVTMPGVQDCAVFGIPDPEYGEQLCAHVELQPDAGLGESDIRRWLTERLANYKIPKVIEFARELPREDSGKIFKRKLRAPYWEGAGRNI
ncbi:acyl-CoA synthetase [Oceanibacterium hippocampi]|uniref:Long-chain-fatty-acid--CoA ligase FadD13 n=1 Tax=Oceanibacterium hippocampi TaxID=745714 RepID=A0A1Y5R6V6_9PROT|nr:acyl-CoA synthetase [Oceanibacterium hippocampi]SLN10555.1 Long-chain-fatty-acid--CoA ligase FadD13 [Oceanibacterium hippocampi]